MYSKSRELFVILECLKIYFINIDCFLIWSEFGLIKVCFLRTNIWKIMTLNDDNEGKLLRFWYLFGFCPQRSVWFLNSATGWTGTRCAGFPPPRRYFGGFLWLYQKYFFQICQLYFHHQEGKIFIFWSTPHPKFSCVSIFPLWYLDIWIKII